jgi:hypothetical protein
MQKPDIEAEEEEQSTPIVEMSSPEVTTTLSENACGKNEALNKLGSNKCTEHGDCDGSRTCSSYGWCQGESGCDKKVVEPEQEVVEVVEIKQEVVEEKAKEVVKPAMVDIFSIEEKQAMQALADMGRIFDDEDEAKMVKLTEDLTAWINKYAPTFEDPEALLF